MDDNIVQKKNPPIVEKILTELGFGWYQARVIIVLGVAHSTDTMETIIQAILGPSLRCDWRISPDSIALLTTLVFLGSCIGAVPMGYIADVFGRKNICLLSCILLTYMSWLCAISPTYLWMALLRFLSGVFIGGLLTSGSCLLTETMPATYQATSQLITYTFETLIGVITAAIGLGCMHSNLNWRYFIFFSTTPLIFCAIGLLFFIQESPVYLFNKKRTIEAAEVLDQIAITNNRMPKQSVPVCCPNSKGLPPKSTYIFSFTGRLTNTSSPNEYSLSKYGHREIIILLFYVRPWLLPLLLILNFLWGFILYGGAIILPMELTLTPRTCLQDIAKINITQFIPTDTRTKMGFECCSPLTRDGYFSLLTSASGGLLSFPLAYLFVTWFGTRRSITVCYSIVTVLLFIESFCLPNSVMQVLFFVARAVASAGYSLTCIYTSNCFQAHVRSLASGLAAAFYRLGILAAPYLGQIFLQKESVLVAILLFALSSLIGSGLTLILPATRGAVESQSKVKRKPLFRNIFKRRARMTPEEAASVAAGRMIQAKRQLKYNKSVFYSPILKPPRVAFVERTFSQLTGRDVNELVHSDFINRNSIFEIDT